MRVRMIFSTRYCGLVPWMLCASFTVRFAMAAAPGSPQHGGKHTHPTSARNSNNFRFLSPLSRHVPFGQRVTSGIPSRFKYGGTARLPSPALSALCARAAERAGLRVGFGAKFYRGGGRSSRRDCWSCCAWGSLRRCGEWGRGSLRGAGGWVARSVRTLGGLCAFDPVRCHRHAGCLAAGKHHGFGGSEAKKGRGRGDKTCATVSPTASVGDGRKPARRNAQTALGVRGRCRGKGGPQGGFNPGGLTRAVGGGWGWELGLCLNLHPLGESASDGHSCGLEILSVDPSYF